MKIPFPRTTRWMADEHSTLPAPVLLLLALVAVGWGAWLFLGRVRVYAVAQSARVEVTSLAHAVQPPVAGVVSESNLSLGREVVQGDVLLVLDTTVERLQMGQEEAKMQGLRRAIEALQRQLQAEADATQAQVQAAQVAAQVARARGQVARTLSEEARREDQMVQELRTNALATGIEALKSASEVRRQQAEAAAASLEARRVAATGTIEMKDRIVRQLTVEHTLSTLQTDLDMSQATLLRWQNDIARRTIRAAVSGTVADLVPVSPGTSLTEGQKIAVIVPRSSYRVVARFAPAEAVGRVLPNQPATVRLDAFPWTEYGALSARVHQVAHEPQDGLVRVELELSPSEQSPIVLGHGLTGSVEIGLEQTAPWRLLLRAAGQVMATSNPPSPRPSSPSAHLP